MLPYFPLILLRPEYLTVLVYVYDTKRKYNTALVKSAFVTWFYVTKGKRGRKGLLGLEQ